MAVGGAGQSAAPSLGGAAALAGAGGTQVSSSLRRLSDRHSAFVQFMKYLLPTAAFALVALVMVWPSIHVAGKNFRLGIMSTITPDDIQNLRMARPRFTGIDEKNRPYTLSAVAARQVDRESDLITLESPKADITLEDGAWLAMTAEAGTYHRKSGRLELTGRVNLFHDSGYAFETTAARVDLKAGAAEGDEPVVAHGPVGLLESQGFRVIDNGRSVLFTGRSRLVLHLKDDEFHEAMAPRAKRGAEGAP